MFFDFLEFLKDVFLNIINLIYRIIVFILAKISLLVYILLSISALPVGLFLLVLAVRQQLIGIGFFNGFYAYGAGVFIGSFIISLLLTVFFHSV